jgi:uncharacterized protein HemX
LNTKKKKQQEQKLKRQEKIAKKQKKSLGQTSNFRQIKKTKMIDLKFEKKTNKFSKKRRQRWTLDLISSS